MPSVTSLSGSVLVNVGPLTTTFTAPGACATPEQIWLTSSTNSAPIIFQSECKVGDSKWRSTCVPPGSSQDAMFVPPWDFFTTVAYYSPALACPDSWTTAGVAVKDEDGSLSSSGLFSPLTTTATTALHPFGNPPVNVFMEAMETGETAVICCPSDYSADPFGNCVSTAPRSSYTASEGCFFYGVGTDATTTRVTDEVETFAYFGTTVTGTIEKFPDDFSATHIQTMTIDKDDLPHYVAVALTARVTLVHKEEDVKDGSDNSGGSDASGGSDDEDAATTSRMTIGSSAGIIASVWGVAIVVGFVFLR